LVFSGSLNDAFIPRHFAALTENIKSKLRANHLILIKKAFFDDFKGLEETDREIFVGGAEKNVMEIFIHTVPHIILYSWLRY